MSRILNIALTTDTILYAPFFLAYIGGDTDDTPFGRVGIRIIGQQDYRFQNPDKRLRGDAFVCYSLLLGLADVGIGDPSVLVDLYNDETQHTAPLCDFVESLDEATRDNLRNNDRFRFLTTKRTEDLAELCASQRLRVVGGLVSKFAFQIVGHPDMIINGTPGGRPRNIGAAHFDEPARDTVREVSEIICYDSPSTGYCCGRLVSAAAAKLSGGKAPRIVQKEFGEELLDISRGKIAVTCDFVATNYRCGGGKRWHQVETPLAVLDDYVDHPDEAGRPRDVMFTGLMARVGDGEGERGDLIRGLLYAIDKNLYEVDQYLTSGDKFGLLAYFEEKLRTDDEEKDSRAKSFLLADKELAKSVSTHPEVRIREIVEFFVASLFEWRKMGLASLFYSEIGPTPRDLDEVCRIRVKALGRTQIKEGLPESLCLDVLNERSESLGDVRWVDVERRMPRVRGRGAWRYLRHSNNLFMFTLLVASVTIVGVLLTFFGLAFPLGSHVPWLKQDAVLHRVSMVVFLVCALLVLALARRWSRSAFLLTYERFVYRKELRKKGAGNGGLRGLMRRGKERVMTAKANLWPANGRVR